jgi:hypothetical protein
MPTRNAALMAGKRLNRFILNGFNKVEFVSLGLDFDGQRETGWRIFARSTSIEKSFFSTRFDRRTGDTEQLAAHELSTLPASVASNKTL